MTFAFIATHRGIWPTEWLCKALGASRAGFYAWRTRSPSARARANDQLLTRVRARFLASDRTYGARRVWHDLLVDGVSGGRHRIERLMRQAALRPALGRCRWILACGRQTLSRRLCSTKYSAPPRRTAKGSRTLPTSEPPKAGFMLPRSSISSRGGWSRGPCVRR